MTLGRYALIVLGIVGGTLPLVWPALAGSVDRQVLWAVLTGAGLAALNTLLAYSLVLWSERRSTNLFLRAVLWGMAGRMAFTLAAMAAAILALGLPKVPLAVSLLSYFVLFLVLELAILQKRTTPCPEAR